MRAVADELEVSVRGTSKQITHLVVRCIKTATAGALVIRLGTRVQSTAKRAATNQRASV